MLSECDQMENPVFETKSESYDIELCEHVIHIPSAVIEERMRLMYIDSVEEAVEDAKDTMEAYSSSLTKEEMASPDFEKHALQFLDCETNIYRR